jgi:hypothetical protein
MSARTESRTKTLANMTIPTLPAPAPAEASRARGHDRDRHFACLCP